MRLVFETGKHSPKPVEQKDALSVNQLLERMAAAGQVSSGISVTPDNAMRCTTVQGIVRALTNAIGSYPPFIGQTLDGPVSDVITPQPSHGLNRLLRTPNAVQTSTEFWRMVMKQCALHGNFYALKGRGQAGPIAYLRPIEDPAIVTVDNVDWSSGVTYKINFDTGERFIRQNEIFHVTSGIVDSDGVTGLSPISLCKEAIGICIQAEKLIAQLYGNNDVPTLALIGGMFRSEEDYALWRAKFKESMGQLGQRGGTLLLPEGMDAKEMSFKPVDAQLFEMRKFQRVEIAQVYGVPPHKLADLERATFSNIEEQSLEFVRDVAKPWVRLMEQAAARDLLTPSDQRAGYVVRFDMEAATEGKLNDRMQAFGKGHEIGVYSPNEIRARLGMPPRDDEGGDAYATALNMRTTDDVSRDPETPADSGPDPDGDEADGGALAAV